MPMILSMLLMLIGQEPSLTPAGPPVAGPSAPDAVSMESRYDACVDLAANAPEKAKTEATLWRTRGGGYFARQCLGIAYANLQEWAPAADEFTAAAQEAEVAHDARAANYWAQAGNAWLAGGDAPKARAALDAALAAGTLFGLQRGEAQFDRARALVAIGDLASARADMDRALDLAPADPLVWLSSATLARRMKDLPRARGDVAEAYSRSPDDPSIHLEIGNIAAMGGDEAGARAAWADAIRIAPGSPAAAQAQAALAQFGDPVKR